MRVIIIEHVKRTFTCPVGQAVKTLPSHGSIGGSIPPRDTKKLGILVSSIPSFYFKLRF